jgi:SOS-response transcriptional repressor LexA
MTKKGFIPNKLKPWIEARKKYHLSHAQVQMARELGLNPKKFGGMANHKQELWKAPLPEYIEHLYEKHFGKTSPADVRPLEIKNAEKRERKAKNKMGKMQSDEAIT